MRSFLKYTLATIVGIIVINILGFFILMGIVSVAVSSAEKKVDIKDNSVLLLKLDAQIVDRAPIDPFENLDLPGFEQSKRKGLKDITDAIAKAKDEDKIKGIYMRVDNVMAGYAMCEEIRTALLDFKESGKFIYAYSENYSQKAYYLASAADKVYINPEGMLMFTGLASQQAFFKNALDKLGIEMQVVRHGKFKAAVEPFMLEEMSDENRRQIEVYIGSIWNTVLEGISASRGISVDELNLIADENMTFRPAKESVTKGLVDDVVYEDQILDILREATGTKANKAIKTHSVSDLKSVSAKYKSYSRDKIAVIYGAGAIGMTSASFGDEAISGPDLSKEIRKARTDSTIKAIVLRVNSPGGSSLASELIWREVKLASEVKPVVVSMGEVAASGGYYIACSADTIVANPTTITGSIGVFGLIPNTEELMEEKLGINSAVVKTNKLSDMPSTNRPMTTTERALMQNMVENVYDTFVNHVAEGRNMSYEDVDAIGQGRVWTGASAKQLGLVDILGDLNDAIEIAKEMAKLENYRLVSYPVLKDPIEEMFAGFSTSVKAKIIERELGAAAKYYYTIEEISKTNGIMARLPYSLEVE